MEYLAENSQKDCKAVQSARLQSEMLFMFIQNINPFMFLFYEKLVRNRTASG